MFCWVKRRCAFVLLKVAVAVSLAACESQNPPATFYPIDSLVSGQAAYLANRQASLKKNALLDNDTTSVRYVPDDTDWRKELEIFRKLDEINKPVNKTNYEVVDGLQDPGSNLSVRSIASREDLPIVYLKVYYQGSPDRPRKIEAMYDEKNLLYRSVRVLAMHFRQIGSETVLTSYSIEGGQKMMFSDSVTFGVSGTVLID